MNVVRDERLDIYTPVKACRKCEHAVYWSLNERGRRTPYEVDAQGFPTRTDHTATCPFAPAWRKPK